MYLLNALNRDQFSFSWGIEHKKNCSKRSSFKLWLLLFLPYLTFNKPSISTWIPMNMPWVQHWCNTKEPLHTTPRLFQAFLIMQCMTKRCTHWFRQHSIVDIICLEKRLSFIATISLTNPLNIEQDQECTQYWVDQLFALWLSTGKKEQVN